MFKSWRLPFRRNECSGLIIGEAASGKTTLLYTLMGMENVETIPTIGFNVEEIPFKSSSKYTLWDVGGGCGKIRPLLRHYITPGRFCIFLHDATSEEEFTQDSLEGFRMILGDYAAAGGGHVFVTFTKQDIMADAELPASSGEKADVDTVSSLAKQFEQIATKFSTGPSLVKVKVLPFPGFSSSDKSCARELMRIIDGSLKDYNAGSTAAQQNGARPEKNLENYQTPTNLSIITDEMIAEAATQKAADFWEDFNSGNLKSWSHGAHLRAGLGIILNDYLQLRGVFDWTDIFLAHLERLRNQQPQLFRNTAHRTMTAFWFHRIYRALRTYMAATNVDGTVLPDLDEFPQVIRCDTSLADRGLWRQYYSQERMFSPEAKAAWCLPDLKQLPDIVPNNAQPSVTVFKDITTSPATDDHLRLPRFAFLVIKTSILTGIRRGLLIKHALPALGKVTMQKRIVSPGKQNNCCIPPPYSETQAYFWIQYVHALVESVYAAETSRQKPTANNPLFIPNGIVKALSFSALQSLYSVTGREWEKFYSPSLWESRDARSTFIQPDIKGLQNVFPHPPKWNMKQAFSELVQRRHDAAYEDPSDDVLYDEKMAFFTELAVSQVEYVFLSDKKLATGERPLGNISDRVGLLMIIYEKLLSAASADDNTLARHARLSQASASLATTLASQNIVNGSTTQAVFWVHSVGESLLQHLQDGHKLTSSADSFQEFLRSHQHLSLPGLPQRYYSLELWESADAKVTYILPDRYPSATVNH